MIQKWVRCDKHPPSLDGGSVMEQIKLNDVVKIKSEWCGSETEKHMHFVVIDLNESTGKCVIEPKDSPLPLAPTEIVSITMIERIPDHGR